MRSTLLNAYSAALRACDILTGLMLAVEVTLITINVTSRFAFSHSWGWMDEICQYTLLWMVALGTVSLMDRYALFYTEVLLLFVESAVIRKVIFVCNSVAMLVFFGVVFWTGITYVRITWSFTLDYSDIPKYWFYSCMPVWGALMFIVLAKKLICMEEPEVTDVDTDL
jgi:TRAP-type C4-dicarboxylate transport system permease small subunit